ncbi:hypothetical protein [Streptomyces sviceus]|uniref:hypothetical protein n=1 Tax=Streptomyces sviceus TaxID=285530 RepID=UPI0036E231FF
MDKILDLTGINWPSLDEDDCREMADAMREFAKQFEVHGAEAHAAGRPHPGLQRGGQ